VKVLKVGVNGWRVRWDGEQAVLEKSRNKMYVLRLGVTCCLRVIGGISPEQCANNVLPDIPTETSTTLRSGRKAATTIRLEIRAT
jgi:hypothetical protein